MLCLVQPSTADGDLAGPLLAGGLHQARLLDRDGAQDHALHACLEPLGDALDGADAAAQLGRNVDVLQDTLDRRAVDRMALDRPVQVDQMQPFAAGVGEGLGLGGGAVVEHGGTLHVAAKQAHALAVLEIDRREKDHGGVALARCGQGRHPARCHTEPSLLAGAAAGDHGHRQPLPMPTIAPIRRPRWNFLQMSAAEKAGRACMAAQ